MEEDPLINKLRILMWFAISFAIMLTILGWENKLPI